LSSSRMFPFITKTWNPVVGCKHGCTYCWARKLAEGKLKETKRYKHGFLPMFWPEELSKSFKSNDFVFVSDMGDLCGDWWNIEVIEEIFNIISAFPETNFLLLTKNPKRYLVQQLYRIIPRNCVLGCTIESDQNFPSLSKAPSQFDRIFWMTELAKVMDIVKSHRLFIAIEPILDFNLDGFSNVVGNWIKPWAVAVGYDNYDNKLPEPCLAKTMQLIDRLEKAEIRVYRKSLREAWNE